MDTLRLCGITWNVKTGWPEQDLSLLLGLPKNNSPQEKSSLPDIYMICLQEVKSMPQNMVMDAIFEEPWTSALREALVPFDFIRLSSVRLQGLVTCILVKRKHVAHVRDIHTTVARTGFGGVWGNKGAGCVRFSIYGCSVCVANSHLAPHDGGYSDRVQHYNAIVEQTEFPIELTKCIFYHDYVFWLGDQNFRLDPDLSAEDIVKRVKTGDLETLYDSDELHKAQINGDAFAELQEAPLTFPPTYRYVVGGNNYDIERRPAWTDRILHHVNKNVYENVELNVDQLSYAAHDAYTQSDHKPVSALFDIKVFANHEERCVHIEAAGSWTTGEGGKVKYWYDSDVTHSPYDYVALYKSDFSSVDRYITYMYVPKPLATETQARRVFQIVFNDELLQEEGDYCLLYYSGKYSSYLGMSKPFHVIKKPAEAPGATLTLSFD
ncbi:phosphatidylinositol 4,5-bisphosphate 5-phosphatase A-like [Oratosquilla oratoria]|uniref:phosphatidylinositol 4,5-bisphosphate 5-phosphatase A-like n=1 Tax=Oratosquilla oratoria TaxID=337810 RepID=UPI003F7710FD